MLLHAGNAIVAIARLRTSGSKEAGSCRPSSLSRMSPPHAGHSSGNSSPTRAGSFAQAIREVSCEGLAPAAQQSVPVPFSLLFPCSRGQAPVPAA